MPAAPTGYAGGVVAELLGGSSGGDDHIQLLDPLVPLIEAEIESAIVADPSFATYTLRSGIYEGMAEPVLTISTPNVLIVHADMDEELAYQVTKTIYDHVDELIAIHPAANDTNVEFAMDSTPIPLHPGALRYFEEVGATIPDRLRP
jgi:TRAP transporter TAXI family solute receptor